MIILQATSKFRMSCRKGIWHGKHKNCRMYLLDVSFFTFCFIPNKDASVFWLVIDKVVGEKEWLINNHKKVTLAIKKAEKESKASLTRIFNDENKKLRERNGYLQSKNDELTNNIMYLKKSINIVEGNKE